MESVVVCLLECAVTKDKRQETVYAVYWSFFKGDNWKVCCVFAGMSSDRRRGRETSSSLGEDSKQSIVCLASFAAGGDTVVVVVVVVVVTQ